MGVHSVLIRKKRIPSLFIISGPSGAGKGTLIKKLLADVPGISVSVSMTTRFPRNSERNGVDYIFVDKKKFRKNIRENSLLEWARVHDDYYGTPSNYVKKMLAQGKDVLLELDVQGAVKVKKKTKNVVLIFIMPLSFKELERRLVKRGTESRAKIRKRLEDAKRELTCLSFYDYLIYNDTFDAAARELASVVTAERLRL